MPGDDDRVALAVLAEGVLVQVRVVEMPDERKVVDGGAKALTVEEAGQRGLGRRRLGAP